MCGAKRYVEASGLTQINDWPAFHPALMSQPSRPSCSSLVERCDGRLGYVFVRSNSHAAKQRTWT